jgi:ribosomal 50S subunit-recycling heat shock protein
MRIDRFLKLSRLVRRRATACEMVSVGAVRLNGKEVKPSADVSTGDGLEIAFPRRLLSVRVLTSDERDIKRGAPVFTITEDRRLEDSEKPW